MGDINSDFRHNGIDSRIVKDEKLHGHKADDLKSSLDKAVEASKKAAKQRKEKNMKAIKISDPFGLHEKQEKDVVYIVNVFKNHGYKISHLQAYKMWLSYSNCVRAEWAELPCNDNQIWENLKDNWEEICPHCGK
jgi:hypothetical protein